MAETFSESWHRIAGQHIELRPTLHIHRQFFRDERWYVISDPLSNQFFRVRSGAYEFLARLGDGRTVEECWQECLRQFPDTAPGQEEVIQLLARLYQGNLIRSDLPPDSRKLFERFKKRKNKELRSKLMSILFIRIPLIDPDSFLKRYLPYLGWCFSSVGAILWLLIIGLAIKTGIDNSAALSNQGQSVLAPSNLGLLYISMAFIKLLHEFGHGYMCRRFGGEVHTMGVMLLILSPLPFVDATSSWGFRSRWQRMLVAAAGMIVELFVASCAMFIWAMTGEGLIHSLAYNVIFVASVSTVLFNANPLLRFDGYYILSDLIDIPNLHQRSRRMWAHICERYLFGLRKSLSPASTRREFWILTIFGALSAVYRIFVFGGILLFVADQYLLLGLVMATFGIFTWLIIPLGKLVQYLISSPRIERVRRRAIASTCLGTTGMITLLAVIPFPHSYSAPGVLQSEGYAGVFSQAPGTISEIVKPAGSAVHKGDILLILRNPELGYQVTQTEAELEEAVVAEENTLGKQGADLEAAKRRVIATRKRLDYLKSVQSNLQVVAPTSGVWVAQGLEAASGAWLHRGAYIGEIVDLQDFRFSAVVSQEDASFLFGETVRALGVRVPGQALQKIQVGAASIIPAQQRRLPSPVLGWLGGGEIAVRSDDRQGTETEEAFFEFRATVNTPAAETHEATLVHGRSGKIRCALPPLPLLQQGYRKLRLLLQQRFQI